MRLIGPLQALVRGLLPFPHRGGRDGIAQFSTRPPRQPPLHPSHGSGRRSPNAPAAVNVRTPLRAEKFRGQPPRGEFGGGTSSKSARLDALHRLINTLCDELSSSASVAGQVEACFGRELVGQQISAPEWPHLSAPIITALEMIAIWDGVDSAADAVRCVQALTAFASRQRPAPPKVGAALRKAMVALCAAASSLPSVSGAQLATLTYNCGKQRLQNDSLISTLLERLSTPRTLAQLGPKDLANALWGAAKSGATVRPEALQPLVRHITRPDVLRPIAPRAAANILWAFARLGLRSPALLTAFVTHFQQPHLLAQCNVQDMASILWAVTTLGTDSPALHLAFADRIVEGDLLSQFTPQGLTNVLWSFATLNVRHDMLFALAADHLLSPQVLQAYNSQDVANTVWSFAALQLHSERLMSALAAVAVKRLDLMSTQHISNMLLSFARLGFVDAALLKAAADHLLQTETLQALSPQELANTMWAYATLKVTDRRLIWAVAKLCLQTSTLSTLNWQELSNVMWSFAVLQCLDERFLLACTACVMRQKAELRTAVPLSVSLIAWAFAILSAGPSPVLSEIADIVAMDGALRLYTAQNIANVAWALAAGNVVHDAALAALLQAAAAVSPSVAGDGRFSNSLHQVVLHVGQHRTALPQCARLLGGLAALCEEWRAAFEAQSQHSQSSAFQVEVARHLEKGGVPHETEVVLQEAGGYSVDFLLPQHRVVLEVDGPQHFLCLEDGSWRPTGKTLLKRRIVEHAGFLLVSVPFYEWERHSPEQRWRYLRGLLPPSVLHSETASPSSTPAVAAEAPDASAHTMA